MRRVSSRACIASLALVTLAGCASDAAPPKMSRETERMAMVAKQLAAHDITDERVLAAMRKVPREAFVPEQLAAMAYDDRPLPIGLDQTISQPFIVGFMTQALALDGSEKVLEIGTGSGYQAAVLAECAREVFSIEIVEPLAVRARATLDSLGLERIHTRIGDGYRGWPEAAPFDAIIVTAAPEHVPEPLIDQLALGGRLVIPVGRGDQELLLLERTSDGISQRSILSVRFVPMTGEAERR